MQSFYFTVWLLLFYFFALSQLLIIFSPKLGGCSCRGKTSSFLCNGRQPTTRERNVPTSSAGHRASHLCGCTSRHPMDSLSVGSIWICSFFTTFQRVSASFFLNPRDFTLCWPILKSNLHEAILLRQALCALLNDGCLRETVIMIDFEP